MNATATPSVFAALRPAPSRRRRAFALIITLLILSLLIIVAVSYLSSMVSERQTSDAYASKTRAEQVAQAGVDSAMAILTQSFRDYPDSATVWDVNQSTNDNASPNNEGTSLYVRAVPDANNPLLSATPAPGSTPGPANDVNGSNPNNPACKIFKLPLVSGVPGGRAQLAYPASAILPTMNASLSDPTKQNFTDLNVRRYAGDTQGVIGSPPASLAGGATPSASPTPSPTPKPARALWVNLKSQAKDATGQTVKDTGGNPALQTTGRYAFWIEDESFRANNSFLGGNTTRPDNTAQPTPDPSPTPAYPTTVRALRPGDLTLVGPLTKAGDSDPGGHAQAVATARLSYPGNFFPDALGFTHGLSSDPAGLATANTIRYLTTNQSGALNFTRHGTRRLNLNGLGIQPDNDRTKWSNPQPMAVTQSAVDQIVQTLKFHLPDFGQRFYRTSAATDSATLNAKQVAATGSITDPATIYLYKVAANLCDYIDTDSQPTMILGPQPDGTTGGQVDNKPILGPLDDELSNNKYWAQGKEASPLIQEVAVRYRPVVGTNTGPSGTGMSPRDFYMLVDYYVEVWNMTNRDVYAVQQPGALSKAPHLNGASLYISDQQPWIGGTTNFGTNPATVSPGDVFVAVPGKTVGETLPNGKAPKDWKVNLSSSAVFVYDSNNKVKQDGQGGRPLGVVFRAGSATIITSDPDCNKNGDTSFFHTGNPYMFISPYKNASTSESSAYGTPGTAAGYARSTTLANASNVFICPLDSGQREYYGNIQHADSSKDVQGAMMFGGLFSYPRSPYSGTEVSLANGYGLLDIVRGAITKVQPPSGESQIFANTYRYVAPNNPSPSYYNDFSFGGALVGNVADTLDTPAKSGLNASPTVSELGDPRTNNEQLAIDINSSSSNAPDGTHFVPGKRTLGTPNGPTVKPDQTIATTGSTGWSDYFAMPAVASAYPYYPNTDATNAPMVIGDGPLTSIGQLGDVYDPARLVGSHPGATPQGSRGGGRTFKIGQHDDRYTFDPTGNPAGRDTSNYASASTGWASWRLADVFSIDDSQTTPGRININGVQRDKGAALLAALYGWTFQPTTSSGQTTDPTIHGDGHGTAGLANQPLDSSSATAGAAQLLNAIQYRLSTAPAAGGMAIPGGPFFERGEFSELVAVPSYPTAPTVAVPLFGTNDASTNTTLVSGVDLNKTFDHSREEMFRRLSELICTRGDTFTVYTIGQSIFQAPIINPANPPPLKVTATHRMRVTFRLVPKGAGGTNFAPAFNSKNPISPQVAARFAKPDHYNAQVLEVQTF